MWVSRILPLLCMTGAVLWVLLSGRSFTMEDILNYTPSQPLLAVLFLWLAFALKSLSLVFPVLLLFAVTGQLFSLPVALAVNTVGIAITLTLPYLLGRAAELDFSDKLVKKYPKLQEVRKMRENSSFFLSFITRAIGVLACDVVMITATILGQQVEDPGSPGFWLAIAANILAIVCSFILYHWYRKKKGLISQ